MDGTFSEPLFCLGDTEGVAQFVYFDHCFRSPFYFFFFFKSIDIYVSVI